MGKFFADLKSEIIILNKTYCITLNLLFTLLLPSTCLPLMLPYELLKQITPILIAIILSIHLSHIIATIIKQEINDGTIELLLTIAKPSRIILLKFSALLFSSAVTLFILLPIMNVFFHYNGLTLCVFFILFLLLVINVSAISLLIAVMQSYFYTNTQFILSFIIPILTPYLIIFGLITYDYNYSLLLIELGLTMVLLPIMLVMSSYLIKNIYKF